MVGSGGWRDYCPAPHKAAAAAAAGKREAESGGDLGMWQDLGLGSLIKALGGSGGAGGGAENHQSQDGWRGGERLVGRRV